MQCSGSLSEFLLKKANGNGSPERNNQRNILQPRPVAHEIRSCNTIKEHCLNIESIPDDFV